MNGDCGDGGDYCDLDAESSNLVPAKFGLAADANSTKRCMCGLKLMVMGNRFRPIYCCDRCRRRPSGRRATS